MPCVVILSPKHSFCKTVCVCVVMQIKLVVVVVVVAEGRGGSVHKPALVVHGLRTAVACIKFQKPDPRGILLPSLRGRRIKGQGKGVLSSRETRGTRAISYPNIN